MCFRTRVVKAIGTSQSQTGSGGPPPTGPWHAEPLPAGDAMGLEAGGAAYGSPQEILKGFQGAGAPMALTCVITFILLYKLLIRKIH